MARLMKVSLGMLGRIAPTPHMTTQQADPQIFGDPARVAGEGGSGGGCCSFPPSLPSSFEASEGAFAFMFQGVDLDVLASGAQRRQTNTAAAAAAAAAAFFSTAAAAKEGCCCSARKGGRA